MDNPSQTIGTLLKKNSEIIRRDMDEGFTVAFILPDNDLVLLDRNHQDELKIHYHSGAYRVDRGLQAIDNFVSEEQEKEWLDKMAQHDD